ncbi:MAG: ArsR family transcriptional regulator [Methanomicrobiales archaeon]|nr:ArsR family transcriptional regulator [Methanomicrobiales archaeon]
MPYPGFDQPDRPLYIGLYASAQGIRAIDSPVKVRILDMLTRQEMAFEDLVEGSGRAKSTVSVHLKDLAESGIVGAKSDPADGRKKIFFLDSLYLAGADSAVRGWFDLDRYIPKPGPCEGDPGAMFRFILSSIRLTLMNQGIMIDPVLRIAGLKAGKALYPCVEAPGIEQMIENIGRIWRKNRLGTIDLEQLNPLTLRISDCFECIDLPISGKPACAFDSGVLSSLFSSFYENQMITVETHCYAMGSNHCRFVVMESGSAGTQPG